jgi:hypothetical protein
MTALWPNLKKKIHFALNNLNDSNTMNWYLRHAGRLERFRDCHKGQDCFIIGNGPSLRKMDLSQLCNYHTFGLNKIYLLSQQVELDLSYHVSVNPLVIEQSIEEFTKLECPSFLAYRPSIPFLNSSDRFYYLATDARCSFYSDITKPIYEGYTVTYVAMQIAYFMGFSRVFLIGVDHSFTCKGEPNEQKFLSGEDLNHFDPSYFANKEWHLPDLEASELSYHLARFFFARDNRQIIDATVEGKLQIFSKCSYNEALHACRKKR